MLPHRLSLAIVAVALASACSSADGSDAGALRENVIEPGVSAVDDAPVVACDAETAGLRTALEAYELLEGAPAPDEQALTDAGLLREPSELWDVVDGEIVAQHPDCG